MARRRAAALRAQIDELRELGLELGWVAFQGPEHGFSKVRTALLVALTERLTQVLCQEVVDFVAPPFASHSDTEESEEEQDSSDEEEKKEEEEEDHEETAAAEKAEEASGAAEAIPPGAPDDDSDHSIGTDSTLPPPTTWRGQMIQCLTHFLVGWKSIFTRALQLVDNPRRRNCGAMPGSEGGASPESN